MSLLILPKTLSFRSLCAAIGAQRVNESDIDEISLGPLTWAQPTGMAALACVVSKLVSTRQIKWRDASNSPAFRYLQNMNFFKLFGEFPEEDFDRRHENRAFARLVRVEWDSDSSVIAKNLAKLIEKHASPLYNDLFTCIEESLRNVIDHSTSPGYCVAQARDTPGKDRVYQIAICDMGRGVPSVLADAEEYRGLLEPQALQAACEKGTTSKRHSLTASGDPTNYGMGLFQIDQIVASTRGKFELASGSTIRVRTARGIQFDAHRHWQGTSVDITLYLSGFRNIFSKPRARRIRLG